MTRNEIKRKIAQLIGKSFEAFGEYKTKEGTELRIDGEKFMEGIPVYVITPEGQLPVSDGEYELEMGQKIKVKAGLVTNVEEISTDGTPVDEISEDSNIDEDYELRKFDEAELADGTIVGTDGDFEVGKKLYVKDQEGEWVQAPEGSHTTKSNIEFVVDSEGTITGMKRPDETGEGSLEEMMGQFASVLERLTKQIVELKKEQVVMNEKFSKIANEPAGEKVFDRKGYLQSEEKNKFSKLELIAALRNKQNN
jgi:hypothetical protein